MSEYSVNIVVGLSGVGKGTVLEEAMMLSDKDYKVVNYGDRMVETAKEQDLVEHRDELKKLDVETSKKVQRDAAESIAEDAENENIIVDTHAAIQTPFGYLPGLPKWTVENLDPEKIVILRASPEAIYRRSQGDDDRDREHDSIEGIKEYQDIAQEMASTNAVMTGAYLQLIENKDGQAEKAAEKLVETLNA